MALFRGILLSLLIEEKKKKKKNASRSWRGENSIFRPLRRGLTGCNGEPLRWRDEAKHLLTYLLTTEETTKKLHALTRSRAMLVKSSLRQTDNEIRSLHNSYARYFSPMGGKYRRMRDKRKRFSRSTLKEEDLCHPYSSRVFLFLLLPLVLLANSSFRRISYPIVR